MAFAVTEAAPRGNRKPRPLPVYLLVREVIDPATGKRIGALVPSSDADRSILRDRGFKRNVKVRAQLTQPRNERFNRLVHGMGRVLAENLERFRGKQAHDAIKALQAESGVYCTQTAYELPGLGTLMRSEPQSLSFDNLGEDLFQDFWRQVCAYLIETDWPSLDEDRLTEMAEFEAFRGEA